MGKRKERDFTLYCPDYYGTETPEETEAILSHLRYQIRTEHFKNVAKEKQWHIVRTTLCSVLYGAARTWYESLPNETRDRWSLFEPAFASRFMPGRRPRIQREQGDVLEHYHPNIFNNEEWELVGMYTPTPVRQQPARVPWPRDPVTPSRPRVQPRPQPATEHRARHVNTRRHRGRRANVDARNDEQAVPAHQLRRSPRNIMVRKRPAPEGDARSVPARYQRMRYVSLDETTAR